MFYLMKYANTYKIQIHADSPMALSNLLYCKPGENVQKDPTCSHMKCSFFLI